jgi:hypothetical protein
MFVAAAAAVGLRAAPARAQAISNAYGGIEAIRDNVAFNTVLRASDTNASVFGAANMAEQVVFPALRKDEDFVFRFVSNTIYGGLTVPVDYLNSQGNVAVGMHPVDFSAVSLCAGYRLGDLGLFYASSMTGTVLAPNIGGRAVNGTFWAFDLAMASVGGAKVEELSDESDINGGNTQADFIVGAQYDLGFVQARAGYVGTTGLFTNVSQSDLRLFFTSVFEAEMGNVPYLRTGIDRLPLDELDLEGAMASLFVRKVRMVAPFEPQANAAQDLASLRDAASFDRWTGHLQQLSIAKHIDVLAAADFRSGVSLHELRAGWHTEGFHRLVPTDPDDDVQPEEGWGIHAGYIHVPDMYYYGLQGGAKLSLTAEARAPVGRIKISRNDPELLAVFPFAYDAWSFSWELGFDSAVNPF